MALQNVTRRLLDRVISTTQLPELAVSTAQVVCKTCNGTLGILNNTLTAHSRAERFKRAAAKTEFDYTDPNGELDADTWTQIYYGIAFVLGFVLVVIQLYTTLFGRRMRMEGLRWHVLFCSIVNLLQLCIYADTADFSPWQDYLRNVYITKHILAIEQITLSAFPASVCCLVPIYILTYASPVLRQTFVFKWLIWVVVYGGLAGGSFLIGLLYWKSLDGSGNIPNNPLTGPWQFYTNAVSWLMLILLVAFNFTALEKSQAGEKFSDNTSLLAIWGYILTCTIFHIPKNIMNMSSFFMTDVLPKLMSLLQWYTETMASFQSSTSSSGGGSAGNVTRAAVATTTAAPASDPTQAAIALLLSYSSYITAFLNFVPTSELLIPIVEFAAAVVFLQMYRESFLNLLSCGACYRSDKNGSIWDIIPYRFRSIYPLEALRWASPAMVAQGLVPPPPAGFAGADNGPMALVHTSSSGKSPILVEQLS
ncbi:hypothetical protein M3Y97_01108200 [Aphelenchoides bicaudatus]|nr:hypothetical protein M3Y97_01108200 [Aphelenchoides bicaudatus]